MIQRMALNRNIWLGITAFVLAVSLMAPTETSAFQESKQSADEKSAKDDPFALPEGDSAELLKFVNKIMSVRKRFRNIQEVREYLTQINAAVETAVGKIIADETADDATVTAAVAARFTMLSRSVRFDPSALKATAEFLKSLESNDRPGVVAEVEKQTLLLRVSSVKSLAQQDQKQLIDDVDGWLAKQELGRLHIGIARQVARGLEAPGKMELAAAAYNRFGARFKLSKDPDIALYGERLEGAARRVLLLGNPITVTGTTLAGEKFDWAPYKGKVVLVDFWATWCGPCIRELPNVKENYDLYHDRGFEVVGISLDTKPERVEAFLKKYEITWTTLYSEDEKSTGWNHPLAVRYGVSAIPNVMLVDQKGNVVSLNARGPELGRLLEKLLGPAEAGDDTTESKPDKADSKP